MPLVLIAKPHAPPPPGLALPAEMRRMADALAGVVQGVGDTVIGARRAERDHLTAGVEKPAIGAIGKSRVTGDLPGGVDPAPQGRFATECTDIDHLTIA